MATLIKEQMRNPINNDWIPLREIEGDVNGVTAIKQLGVDGNPVNLTGPLQIVDGEFLTVNKQQGLLDLGLEGIQHSSDKYAIAISSGGTGATNNVDALHNLGIYWGTDDAETYWSNITNGDELKKNTIYIQLIAAE